jgi:ABC-type branched-subunit amino acid transport system substrate-binding protein
VASTDHFEGGYRQRQTQRARPRRARAKVALLLAAGVALTLGVAACSSSGGKSTTGTSTSAKTVVVGLIIDITGDNGANDQYVNAFKGDVAAINSRGGIHGATMKLDICDSASNDNANAACGRQLVEDKPIAIIDGGSSAAFLSYAEQAKIPVFSNEEEPQEWSSPVVFTLNSEGLGASEGFAALAKSAGCASFNAIWASGGPPAETKFISEGMADGAKRLGVVFKGLLNAPPTSTSFQPFVSEAINQNPSCTVIEGFGAPVISVIKGLQTGSSTIKVLTGDAYIIAGGELKSLQPTINALGPNRFAFLTPTELPSNTTNPLVQQWKSDIAAAPKPSEADGISGVDWAYVKLAAQVGTGIYPNETGTAALAYLGTLKNFDPGVVPPVDFAAPVPKNIYGPRMFASWIAPAKLVNGVEVRSGPFVNLLTGAVNNNDTAS